jgi:DNA polymerase III delta prime subunit
MSVNENPLWFERYRPQTVADTILPKELKKTFQAFVDQRSVPNLLLVGRPGVGKTTIARAMLEEIGCEYIVINGSLKGNIDTLRTDLLSYATSMSIMAGGRKYVILDEADYLNPNSTQPALRNFMEEYSENCGFILTANYKNKIIAPLSESRCSVIEFKIPNEEKPELAAQFYKRAVSILHQEKVTFDAPVVAQLIQKYFPDLRRILNELQRYSVTGKIDSGILASFNETTLKKLIGFLKDKNFTDIRKWIAENSDMESVELYQSLYENSAALVAPKSIPVLVLILAKYQYQDSFALDKQINTAACLLEIMAEVQFK